MEKEVIYETLYDLSYLAGVDKLSALLEIDSRELYDILWEWAVEFEKIHDGKLWGVDYPDYLTTVTDFYNEKANQLENEINGEKYREMQLGIISKLEALVHKRFNEETLNAELSKIFGSDINVELICEDVDYLTDWNFGFTNEADIIGGDFDIYFLKHRQDCDNKESFMVTEVGYEFNNRYY